MATLDDTLTLEPSRQAAETNAKRPPLFIAADELFFWTTRWQAGERESATERERGNVKHFTEGKDLLNWLRADDDEA